VSEVDLSLYPSVPALKLKCLGPRQARETNRPKITLSDSIQTVSPGLLLSRLIARERKRGIIPAKIDVGFVSYCYEVTWLDCLGLPKSNHSVLRNPVPAEFAREAIEEYHSWLVRKWTCSESGRNIAPRGFWDMVFDLAANNKGRPWRMSDLQTLVNWFGERQEEIERMGGGKPSGKAGKNIIYSLHFAG
jgi:hypothetical protein